MTSRFYCLLVVLIILVAFAGDDGGADMEGLPVERLFRQRGGVSSPNKGSADWRLIGPMTPRVGRDDDTVDF